MSLPAWIVKSEAPAEWPEDLLENIWTEVLDTMEAEPQAARKGRGT